jgi:hypothetical protein
MTEHSPKPVPPPPEALPSLLESWLGVQFDIDRTLVTLSSGGVALLVGLLATVADAGAPFTAYWLALGAFIAAIGVGIAVGHLNAKMLEETMQDVAAARGGRTRTWLRGMSWTLHVLFAAGVILSVWVGFGTAVTRPPTPPTARTPMTGKGKPHQLKPTAGPPETRALDKLPQILLTQVEGNQGAQPQQTPPMPSGGNATGEGGQSGGSSENTGSH